MDGVLEDGGAEIADATREASSTSQGVVDVDLGFQPSVAGLGQGRPVLRLQFTGLDLQTTRWRRWSGPPTGCAAPLRWPDSRGAGSVAHRLVNEMSSTSEMKSVPRTNPPGGGRSGTHRFPVVGERLGMRSADGATWNGSRFDQPALRAVRVALLPRPGVGDQQGIAVVVLANPRGDLPPDSRGWPAPAPPTWRGSHSCALAGHLGTCLPPRSAGGRIPVDVSSSWLHRTLSSEPQAGQSSQLSPLGPHGKSLVWA